ncbi:LysE family translocator [Reichenbachiella ulvae]|uniref:LysE family transporter n=1 Tax=Reichenbachiella ulvae TaxID=2980104 RepID=A0ABT3CPG0_9BACT|nr:LysE family transporter [Reichenbachiella ulvae]MCV9385502.1 LysE family transporter [Reichenbachiella ulvae]
MPPYLIGLSTGLILAVSTGPIFLTLLQKSLQHGFKKSLFFVAGVGIADSGIIFLTWLGMSQVAGDEPSPWLALGGGLLLIVFGLTFVFRKEKQNEEPKIETDKKKHLAHAGLFMQGLMLGAINPVVWGFWAAMSNYAITTFSNRQAEFFYFLGILNTVWVTDTLKAYFAPKLKTYLSQKVQRYLRIGIGVVLIGLGLKLIIENISSL